MKTQDHLTDNDLRQVVLENHTDRSQEQIESHVSDCQWCQERLLQAAADETWREDFSSSIQEVPGLATPLDTGTYSAKKENPVGDEFDLLTVDQMLQETLQPPTHPEMLGRLGRYDIESVLGCGGMGVVLRGFDRDLHRPVAIKMILPRLSKNGTAKQRFEREARAAAAVLHPNVIAIHGINQSAGVPWFVMPLVAGPSLAVLVKANGPLPEREIVRIGLQIASGLAAAHSQGLVHRDIKPENILVDNQVNRVLITDFGLARRDSEESMTQTGLLTGTLNYMSPEQSRGEDIDGRSDLFSLGGLLFYLAAGVVPFKADSPMKVLYRIGSEQHPNVRSLNPEISATLSDLIDHLLEKSPQRRFQSAVDVESFLSEYSAHLNHPTRIDKPSLPGSRKSKASVYSPWLIGATIALAVLGSIVSYLPYWGTPNKPVGPVPTPNPITTSPSPAPLTYSIVKERHGLESEDLFLDEMIQLGNDVNDIASALEASELNELSGLESHEAQKLSEELNTLRKALDFPDLPSTNNQ